MMTSVLMGAYPDLFVAGSAFSGVPYGCFEGPDMWNEQCALGEVIMTPQQWVRDCYRSRIRIVFLRPSLG